MRGQGQASGQGWRRALRRATGLGMPKAMQTSRRSSSASMSVLPSWLRSAGAKQWAWPPMSVARSGWASGSGSTATATTPPASGCPECPRTPRGGPRGGGARHGASRSSVAAGGAGWAARETVETGRWWRLVFLDHSITAGPGTPEPFGVPPRRDVRRGGRPRCAPACPPGSARGLAPALRGTAPARGRRRESSSAPSTKAMRRRWLRRSRRSWSAEAARAFNSSTRSE